MLDRTLPLISACASVAGVVVSTTADAPVAAACLFGLVAGSSVVQLLEATGPPAPPESPPPVPVPPTMLRGGGRADQRYRSRHRDIVLEHVH